MDQISEFDTATMAKVYAQQGYLRKAAAIYRRIIAADPDRTEVVMALEALETAMAEQQGPTRMELGLQLREWADLMNCLKSKKRFKIKEENG